MAGGIWIWINIVLKRPWHIGGEFIPAGTWWDPDKSLEERKVGVLKGLVRKFPGTLRAKDLRTLRWKGVPGDGGKTQGVLALAKKRGRGKVVAITACSGINNTHFENARRELGMVGEVPVGLELIYEEI